MLRGEESRRNAAKAGRIVIVRGSNDDADQPPGSLSPVSFDRFMHVLPCAAKDVIQICESGRAGTSLASRSRNKPLVKERKTNSAVELK